MGLGLAIKLFWRGLRGVDEKPSAPIAPPLSPPQMKPVSRSDAITLLATLQQEGRLIDFLMEPITAYSDAQIGAAVRDIHRDCSAVLERVFAIKPLLDQADGSLVDVPAGFETARYRLSGNVTGTAPFHGKLRHGGWMAAKVQLPEWNGSTAAIQIVAPAEVEL